MAPSAPLHPPNEHLSKVLGVGRVVDELLHLTRHGERARPVRLDHAAQLGVDLLELLVGLLAVLPPRRVLARVALVPLDERVMPHRAEHVEQWLAVVPQLLERQLAHAAEDAVGA